MELIVPVAGASSRFAKLTDTPKWALKLGEKFVLGIALEGFLSALELDRIVFISLQSQFELLTRVIESLSISVPLEIVTLPRPTSGQGATTYQGLVLSKIEGPFLIWNSDTGLRDGWLEGQILKGNNFAVSMLEGNHWSFAKINKGLVVKTAEKVRISEWASIGLYGWETVDLYKNLFLKSEKLRIDNESFIAPIYNHAIEMGRKVEPVFVRPGNVITMGTPVDLLSTALSMGLTVTDEIRPDSAVQLFFSGP